MSRRKHHPRENPHLAQWLFLPISGGPTHCQGTVHHRQRRPPQATWESRIYQDIERADSLMTEGVPREQINQLIWDAACKEQDTIGIVIHKIVHLCDACAEQVIMTHGGQPAAIAIVTAKITGNALLLVSDRETERAGVVCPVPREMQEEELLEKLRGEMIDIRIKNG